MRARRRCRPIVCAWEQLVALRRPKEHMDEEQGGPVSRTMELSICKVHRPVCILSAHVGDTKCTVKRGIADALLTPLEDAVGKCDADSFNFKHVDVGREHTFCDVHAQRLSVLLVAPSEINCPFGGQCPFRI